MTAPRTAPADVAERVADLRKAAAALTDSSEPLHLFAPQFVALAALIDALAAELAAMRERAERAEAVAIPVLASASCDCGGCRAVYGNDDGRTAPGDPIWMTGGEDDR